MGASMIARLAGFAVFAALAWNRGGGPTAFGLAALITLAAWLIYARRRPAAGV